MKVRLLHPERDEHCTSTLPPRLADLVEADLELGTVYTAMANGDDFLRGVAREVVLSSLEDPYIIEYRQNVLADCAANEEIVEQIYCITVDAGLAQRKIFLGGLLTRDPTSILRRAVSILEFLVENLKQLRTVRDAHSAAFQSDGFSQFWAMVRDQLDDAYLATLDDELAELELPRGTLLSAQIGQGNKGRQFRLHRSLRHRWWEKLTGSDHPGLGFTLDDRDQAGSEALSELAGRAINDAADAASQAADHIQGFFARLRFELGFYLSCLNLQHRLDRLGVPTCYPTPAPLGSLQWRFNELRDIALCLTTKNPVVGNTVAADGMRLVVVTGANEGGKSTFLRSLGAAQMMLQAGMFVPAESFTASVTAGVYTHFKREEDATMTHGKLDEELARMSAIADAIRPNCLLLCNESFASTSEREGSQIGRGVIDALTTASIGVVSVTHMFDLARSLYDRRDPGYLFLRAERRDDSTRTYRLAPAAPEPTSHGLDSFARVFGEPVRSTVGR
ncbi:putative DNA mismatch repair protein [uncultured Mycobacterium sp.]|uniref:Putative DNA mismatch repair protein n=1 Tax=uncultured Mycobacterium sp. TaxID=171292 RepID=A0A1Y5PQH2_9MYCO|nr:putative DNA mismatch repair protein [uncultured Mycobacterium sp.]